MLNELANRRDTLREMFRDGGVVAAKSAIVGSVLFALIDTLHGLVNNIAYLAGEHLSDQSSFLIGWFFLLAIIGCILTLPPAIAGGCGLAFAISRRRFIHSKWSAMLLAGFLGMTVVAVISLLNLFIVLAAHDAWTLNTPAFAVYLERLATAAVIAAACGGYTAWRVCERQRE